MKVCPSTGTQSIKLISVCALQMKGGIIDVILLLLLLCS